MRKTLLPSVLLAALAFSSLTAHAAPPTPAAPAMADSMANPMAGAMVNLNTADAATLQKELAGIGAAKANAIVAFREANGPFASVDELLEVQGIGQALVDRNRNRLAVK
ncbi:MULTISPECIES: ComEA family DNA-binding protein [Pseudomonas]|uniref:Helix-hairpin-helix domain-containing protein n=1 Tax=Pseudomonas quercus TaxID=2722792 RepID=A0ABX0YGI4_9PSED|nr:MULTISPECIES: helix-hairpin-helix domain-containing protein [Pseudomonas]MBF7143470.1 helix-hairpin-helix domain-containing protein [Pseudomonas sp. LY10J]NJP02136.1 helix-hairpin-helix domain-containing protein [Pseudomonas quercus]